MVKYTGGYIARAASQVGLLFVLSSPVFAAEFFVSPLGTHEPPFASWQTAATNIQDAIDVAAASDVVWVTNGIYDSGGKKSGDGQTNRVAVDKALAVKSVNGPEFTTIVGMWDPQTNGPLAVRCAWLASGAVLDGFTLYRGATLATSSGFNGGGACGASTTATVINSVLATNSASRGGGGAYNVTLKGCTLVGNEVVSSPVNLGNGGGALNCNLDHCRVFGNRTPAAGGGISGCVAQWCAINGNDAGGGSANYANGGGGAHNSVLVNCTLAGNQTAVSTYAPAGAAVKGSTLTNCVVFGNMLPLGSSSGTNLNYESSTFSFSCTVPLPEGEGNIAVDPQFLSDRFHLSDLSPCRGAGKALLPGTDLDGQPWSTQPSMGCDEWYPDPLFEGLITVWAVGAPPKVMLRAPVIVGERLFGVSWQKNGSAIEDDARVSGTHDTTLVITDFGLADAGQYQVLASNSVGVVISAVLTVTVRCVDAGNSSSLPPYTTWETAANNIQGAIDAASAGDVILVTNGIYAIGGKVIEGGLTNRVALDKVVVLSSVSGAERTIIEGLWDPAKTNGPLAVRCVWLASGSSLNGFTLRRGATFQSISIGDPRGSGGGAWGASTNAVVSNCVITTNSASVGGAGAFGVSLVDCVVVGNRIPPSPSGSGLDLERNGGGAAYCYLRGCLVSANHLVGKGAGIASSRVEYSAIFGNVSERWAGGAYKSTLANCTVAGNRTGKLDIPYAGGAVRDSSLTNCVVYSNSSFYLSETNVNFTTSTLTYSCSNPLPLGEGNINADPQLLSDSIHLSETSPCRGAGTNLLAGSDIDGQPWQSTPSIGCDEWHPAPVFLKRIRSEPLGAPVSLRLVGPLLSGKGPWSFTWGRDGQPLEETEHYGAVNTDSLLINRLSPEDSGVYQLTASNDFGSTSTLLDMTVRCVNAENATSSPPFNTWALAATNIQDAIDAASANDVVLVTNGLYSSGGRVALVGDVTNRVVIDKPLVVTSLNGYKDTIIEGNWDPNTTNGPLAVRGAYLVNGAILNGFTVRGGASGNTFPTDWHSVDGVVGGGVWAQSTNAFLFNSLLYGNSAAFSGGGCANLSVRNCTLRENYSAYGAGAYDSRLTNCLFIRNKGGGVYGGALVNSTVVGNLGYGAESIFEARNSIIYSNFQSSISGPRDLLQQMSTAAVSYSCVGKTIGRPLTGVSNIVADPQILGDYRLSVASPCRGTGSAAFVSGTDLDGQPWANPPSMGCSEVWEQERIGPLTVALTSSMPEVALGGMLTLVGSVTGNATRVGWDFGDGLTLTNQSLLAPSHSWTNPGDYTITFAAYNTDHVDGVSTNLVVHVIPLEAPPVTFSGMTGTNFGLAFSTQPGVTYAVQRTTNLAPPIVWQTLTIIQATGKYDFNYTDTKATNDASFYRIYIP